LTSWRVDGLAVRARGAIGVDAQFLVDKLDLDVVVDLSSTDRRRCEAQPRTAAS
jgi:hypothetical protein